MRACMSKLHRIWETENGENMQRMHISIYILFFLKRYAKIQNSIN